MEDKRASSTLLRCRRAVGTLGLLLFIAPHAWADSDCQLAFEKWAKLSSALLRVVPQSESHSVGGRGACVPTEAMRNQLLDGLASTLRLCAESPPSSDQSARQARTLLNINRSFIASLVVCLSDDADLGTGWTTKSAPAAEKPKVVAPPPAAPRPIVTAPLPTPPCLEIAPAKEEHYALINRRCRGHTVLAVIETRGDAGETVCKGYSVSQSLAIRAPGDTPPRLNHECVLSHGPCNKDRLGSMFPECDW